MLSRRSVFRLALVAGVSLSCAFSVLSVLAARDARAEKDRLTALAKLVDWESPTTLTTLEARSAAVKEAEERQRRFTAAAIGAPITCLLGYLALVWALAPRKEVSTRS